MFLRANRRRKNGKWHRYFSIVESRRLPGHRVVQRQVLYLGEINDSQETAWRRSLEVFDEQRGQSCQLSLFPDDRPLPADAVNGLSLRLSEMKLRHSRSFGDCWLGCVLWKELELDRFWDQRLGQERGEVAWAKVLQLLVINRLCSPGSEWRVHRQWFGRSAMDELLGVDEAAAGKDRLYRCLDRLLAHKDELCRHLVGRWRDLFHVQFDVLLYDLTSTYFEGQCQEIPKAKHGYSRDGRPDCRQVVIALVVSVEGLPLAYEVMAGNTSDKTTLRAFIDKIHGMYGQARRVWVMDRGIPTEATLKEMRQEGIAYLVGTPKTMLSRFEAELCSKPWEQVHPELEVKLADREGELYVLARSDPRRRKEAAMRRRRLKALVHGLNKLKRRPPKRDVLLGKVAVLRKEAGRVARFVRIELPGVDEPVNRQTFRCTLDRIKYRAAVEKEGAYLLRSNQRGEDGGRDAAALWRLYMQLVQVEAAFKGLKSEMAIRPIWHQVEPRVEAHILVAFLGYCLLASLRMKLSVHAPGLTATAALETLAGIRMVDVWIPTTDGRWLIMPRHTEPEAEQSLVLEKLKLQLPAQPPPRVRAEQVSDEQEERAEPKV